MTMLVESSASRNMASSSSGARAVHGPFEVGANFGIDSSAERFRWDDTANAIAQLKALARSTASSNAGKLWVEQAGFHRVTATQLAAAGVHLEGVPVERIGSTGGADVVLDGRKMPIQDLRQSHEAFLPTLMGAA